MKLYEISENIQELINMIDDIDDQTFNDTMESLQLELHDKADNYAKVIKVLEGEINTIKNEVERLGTMKKARENKIEWLKSTLEEAMIHADDKKFKTELFTFGIQRNPAKLTFETEEFIPLEYYVEQKPKLDNTKLKEDIKSGKIIKGVSLIQGEGLRIR
jgi:hypothetical protein